MTGKNKIKILVVDDEPTVTRMIGKLLVRRGFDVIMVNDPVKVEEYLLSTRLGLVVTDYQMPGMDGLQVLELIKKSDPELPVIFLTGHGTIDTAVQATKGGAVVFLTKPFEPDDLVAAVESHARVDQALADDVLEYIEAQGLTDESLVVSPDSILLENEIVSTETIPEGLVEIKFEDILPGQVLPFSLHLQILNKNTKKHILRKICEKNTVFTTGFKEMLDKRRLGSAYIMLKDYDAYLEYINAVKSTLHFKHQKVKEQKKLLLYGKAVEAVTDILNDPANNMNIKKSVELVDDIFLTLVNDPETYQGMFKLFKRDTSIFNHSAHVCLLSVSYGIKLGLDQEKARILGLGGLFHDVGMNKIDKRILEKKTSLTPFEWSEIKKHPERGMALMKGSRIIPISSLKIILEHHEKEDGSGYPRGLKGSQISAQSSICRIIDKFDSMTAEKPYRQALSATEALKRIFLSEPNPNMHKHIKRFITLLGGE